VRVEPNRHYPAKGPSTAGAHTTQRAAQKAMCGDARQLSPRACPMCSGSMGRGASKLLCMTSHLELLCWGHTYEPLVWLKRSTYPHPPGQFANFALCEERQHSSMNGLHPPCNIQFQGIMTQRRPMEMPTQQHHA